MGRPDSVPALMRGDAAASIRRFGYEPHTTGVPVLPPDANEAAWLAARRPLVTASEIAAVLGVSPHDSAYSLWWRKQPDWPELETTTQMHIGRKLEAVIGELWQEATPEAALFRPGASLWGHPVETWLGATPDYLSVWPDYAGADLDRIVGVHVEPVECKSDEGGDGWGKAGTDEVPRHHLCQVVTQCMVLGARRGHIMRLSGKRATPYVINLSNHQDLIADIVLRGRQFHASLDLGIPPDIDGHLATTETLQAVHANVVKGTKAIIPDDMAKEYRDALAARDAAAVRVSLAQNQIRDIIGRDNAQYAVTEDGTKVASRSVYKRQSYMVKATVIDSLRSL